MKNVAFDYFNAGQSFRGYLLIEYDYYDKKFENGKVAEWEFQKDNHSNKIQKKILR